MKKYFIVLAGLFLLIFSLTAFNFPDNYLRYKNEIEIAGQRIKVILAQTPETRAQGLSGRSYLREDEGMLFVFSAQGGSASGGDRTPRFWMKDMLFPIDIIWIDENLKVIYIKKDARPESFPETFGPDAEALYVLEVAAGFSEKHNLQVGDRVELIY